MKKQKWWRALETLADGATLAEWALELGNEFEHFRPFVVETKNEARTYPCPRPSRCQCRQHRIELMQNKRRMAVCECGECEPLDLTSADLAIYELDKAKFAKVVAGAFGWSVATEGWEMPVWRLGRWNDLRSDLFWGAGGGPERTRKIVDSLLASESSPFLLLMPTATNLSSRLDAALKREGCLAVPLDEYLAMDRDGKLKLVKSLETARQEFLERSAKRDTAKVLHGIHEKVSSVETGFQDVKKEVVAWRTDYREVQSAKARLEKMQADGLMKFTAKVDGKSFHILCAIIACGDVAKASRALKMGDTTVRDVINSWKTRGPSYAVMSDLVRWRKSVGGEYKVPFNDAMLYEKEATTGNETVFTQLLDDVLSMTDANWQDICAELEATLNKQLGR